MTAIGVRDGKWREAVKAVVSRREVMKASEEELIEHCKQTLASYKESKSSDFLGHLPRNVMGKDFETDLRQKYWHGHAKRIQ